MWAPSFCQAGLCGGWRSGELWGWGGVLERTLGEQRQPYSRSGGEPSPEKAGLRGSTCSETQKFARAEEATCGLESPRPRPVSGTGCFPLEYLGKGISGPAVPVLVLVVALACHGSLLACCWSPPRTLGYNIDIALAWPPAKAERSLLSITAQPHTWAKPLPSHLAFQGSYID